MSQYAIDYSKLRKRLQELDWDVVSRHWLPSTLDVGSPHIRGTLSQLLRINNRDIRFLSLSILEGIQSLPDDINDGVRGVIVTEALLAGDCDIAVRAAHRVLSMGAAALYPEAIAGLTEAPNSWPSELIDMCIELQRAREMVLPGI